MIDYIIKSFTTGRCDITVMQQIVAGVTVVIGALMVLTMVAFFIVLIQKILREIKKKQ